MIAPYLSFCFYDSRPFHLFSYHTAAPLLSLSVAVMTLYKVEVASSWWLAALMSSVISKQCVHVQHRPLELLGCSVPYFGTETVVTENLQRDT